MQIATNVAAINAQRNLSMTSLKMGKVLEKLSSGYRINRAADDAAGLGISEKMRSQIRGSAQALRNSQDGISMIQTAEGAMDEIHSILQRARELAVQAANGSMDTAARTSIGTELVALQTEINRIASATQFNGAQLLNGTLVGTLDGASATKVGTVLSGAGGDATVAALDVGKAQAGVYGITSTATTMTINGETVTVNDMAANSSQVLNFAATGITMTLVTGGGAKTAANINTDIGDFGAGITVTGTGSAVFQVGANVGNTMNVAFNDVRANVATGLNLTTWVANTVVQDLAASNSRLTEIDTAITTLNTRRADLGAAQNRLEHTIASLGVAVENLSAAESRIRDADVAELSSQMVSNQILSQAGVSVLAQANQAPQSVLKLLQ
ncbi:MAG: flagellin [Dehalococcoidia bacterium]|nr:flagellin [Dehalococcoidia bacterium]